MGAAAMVSVLLASSKAVVSNSTTWQHQTSITKAHRRLRQYSVLLLGVQYELLAGLQRSTIALVTTACRLFLNIDPYYRTVWSGNDDRCPCWPCTTSTIFRNDSSKPLPHIPSCTAAGADSIATSTHPHIVMATTAFPIQRFAVCQIATMAPKSAPLDWPDRAVMGT